MASVHLVPHTHWDREWYLPFQSFRLKLVGLVDRLLDLMEADERFRFTLDGQLATLDDYLEVRPEAESRIRRLVEEERLAIGPWQVLMDEFFVSGETIVRNLERGLRRGDELGGAMRIGYLPDMFGHVAQMPQILRLAGIDQAVVWRGVPSAIDSHAFEWEAPDGSSVRTEYLPHGYGNGATLLDVPGGLATRLGALRESLREFFDGEPVLAMYGTDHTEPLPELADLIEQSGAEAELSTLPGYLAATARRDGLQRWRGELRSGARANLLMGTTSARIDLKAAMARAERALTRYAEPFQALYGSAWPERLLEVGWRRVFECSAHDSICGCSADEVSAQVLVRCAEAEQIGLGLAEEAAGQIARRAPRGSIVVLNPSPWRRTGTVELNVRVPDDWDELALELPDGTLVATQEVSRNEPVVHSEEIRGAEVPEWTRRRVHQRELFARQLNGVELGERTVTFDVDEEADPPWLDVDDLKREVDVATRADPDATWTVRIVARPRRRIVANVPAPPLGWTSVVPVNGSGELEQPVRVEPRRLDNGLVEVAVANDGTLELNGLRGVGRLVDGGDVGDSYNYAPPEPDRIVDEPDDVHVEQRAGGPVRGELAVVRSYDWGVPVETTTAVEVRAGEPFCRICVSFDNPRGDHRLRFHVPLAEQVTSSAAEGQFAVVERGLEAEGGFGEEPLPTFPAHGFVAAGGIAVLLDHVLEYELMDGRELALTLLRSIGLISRSAHPYRESPAGPELEIPAAQCRGPWSVSFALFPYEGEWHDAGIHEQLERYRHPFLAAGATGSGPEREGHGPELPGVVLSSLRRIDGKLVARVANEVPHETQGLRPWEICSVQLGPSGGSLEWVLPRPPFW